MSEPDAKLAQSAIEGDKKAFGVLYRRHWGGVVRFAAKLVGSRAHDAAQESFLAAYLSLSQLRRPEYFRTWLFGIVLNVCRRSIRSDAAEARLQSRLSGGWFQMDPAVDPEEAIVMAYEADRVRSAIQTLPIASRRAVKLRYMDMLTVQEAGTALGIGTSAMKTRLHRARAHLLDRLSATEYKRRTKMRRVEVLDVISDGIVLFIDWDGGKVFPIFMSKDQVQSIATGIKGTDVGRPLTFQFVANLMKELGGKAEKVVITSLAAEGTFYAKLHLNNGKEIDARPSDAVNLAIVVGAPLYADEEVIERTGIDVDVDSAKRDQYREKGISNLTDEIKMLAMMKMQREGLRRYVQALFSEGTE